MKLSNVFLVSGKVIGVRVVWRALSRSLYYSRLRTRVDISGGYWECCFDRKKYVARLNDIVAAPPREKEGMIHMLRDDS